MASQGTVEAIHSAAQALTTSTAVHLHIFKTCIKRVFFALLELQDPPTLQRIRPRNCAAIIRRVTADLEASANALTMAEALVVAVAVAANIRQQSNSLPW